MDFDEFLESKKIDSTAFKSAEPDKWNELASLFNQVHPKSFTSQKLFIINPTRRKYPLPLEAKPIKEKPQKMKPKIRPKTVGDASEKEASKPLIKQAKPKVKVKPKVMAKPKVKPSSGTKPKPIIKKPKTNS